MIESRGPLCEFEYRQTAEGVWTVTLLSRLAAIPCLVGIQQAVLWRVLLPALGGEQMAKIKAASAKRYADTSLIQVGDTSPTVSVMTIDGERTTLPSPGNVVLINFFATWCGPCQLELPHIEKLWSQNKNDEHFRLVAIGCEETEETAPRMEPSS